jgi:hypothetical protein
VQRALEHLDRRRAAVRRADEAIDDLGRARLAVARVAELGQRAAAALEVGGRHVVEHERPLLEVAAGQRPLDPLLASEQPVERPVERVLVRALDPEHGGERRLGEGARHRQLGAGGDHTLDDHRHTQRPLPRGPPVEQPGQLKPPGQRQQRLDVTRRQRALDAEALVERDEALAPERRPHQLDASSGRCEMLPTVSFLTLPPSRQERRNRCVTYSRCLPWRLLVTTRMPPVGRGFLHTAEHRAPPGQIMMTTPATAPEAANPHHKRDRDGSVVRYWGELRPNSARLDLDWGDGLIAADFDEALWRRGERVEPSPKLTRELAMTASTPRKASP